jgi:membrane-associated protease RseP (regulator of RpoE activity)
MPRILELGLNRIFRSRWGVALILLLIVLAVVGVARLFSGDSNTNQPSLSNNSPAPAFSIDPSDDDSVIDSAPPPSPSTIPGRAQPEAVAYAFASAWVDHKNVSPKTWRDQLLPNSTKKLADELDGVDPAGVPAERVLGRPSLVPISETVVTADVTMDSGKLSLRLISPDGHWLVDGIDWAPA